MQSKNISDFYYYRLTQRLSALKEKQSESKNKLKTKVKIIMAILLSGIFISLPGKENNLSGRVQGAIVKEIYTKPESTLNNPSKINTSLTEEELNLPIEDQDIEKILDDIEKNELKILSTKQPEHIEKALSISSKKYGMDIGRIIKEKSQKYGMDEFLITRQLYKESRFDRYARSTAGAHGIGQFLQSTGKQYGLKNMVDLQDPEKNIDASVRLMRDSYLEFLNSKTIYYGYNRGNQIIYYNKPNKKHYKSVVVNPTKSPVIAYKYALAKYNGGDGGVLYFAKRGGQFYCDNKKSFASYARQTACYVNFIMLDNYTPRIN